MGKFQVPASFVAAPMREDNKRISEYDQMGIYGPYRSLTRHIAYMGTSSNVPQVLHSNENLHILGSLQKDGVDPQMLEIKGVESVWYDAIHDTIWLRTQRFAYQLLDPHPDNEACFECVKMAAREQVAKK